MIYMWFTGINWPLRKIVTLFIFSAPLEHDHVRPKRGLVSDQVFRIIC